NAIEAFFTRLSPRTPPRNLSFAAIGPATRDALQRKGYLPAVVPERFVAEEVFRALADKTAVAGKRFLLPRAEIAREALPRLLESAGAQVDVVTAYRTVPSRDEIAPALERLKRGAVDIVTFTSPSTVRSFFDGIQLSDIQGKFTCASIGPITSAALGELGLEVGIEAESYTSEGLVEAIVRHYERMES
ncbi:MAG TPA: uroporphyrinogen-III synthase, partial [Vicinamibacteria bacterium]|nr:uroporphyrinogen-III synthase [Vicinamibacteria bacterium]